MSFSNTDREEIRAAVHVLRRHLADKDLEVNFATGELTICDGELCVLFQDEVDPSNPEDVASMVAAAVEHIAENES